MLFWTHHTAKYMLERQEAFDFGEGKTHVLLSTHPVLARQPELLIRHHGNGQLHVYILFVPHNIAHGLPAWLLGHEWALWSSLLEHIILLLQCQNLWHAASSTTAAWTATRYVERLSRKKYMNEKAQCWGRQSGSVAYICALPFFIPFCYWRPFGPWSIDATMVVFGCPPSIVKFQPQLLQT